MSSTSDPANLQFERADFAGATPGTPGSACAFCQRPIADHYFEVNGRVTCPVCHDSLRRQLGQTAGVAGVLKAIGAGLGAGVVGSLLYYVVYALTGYQFGLIAVVVGFLVGRAVRWGSDNRGGRIYQALAVLITYVAIVSSFVPAVMGQMRERAATEAAAAATPGVPPRAVQPSLPRLVVGFVLLTVVLLPVPFLSGDVLGLVIIGFALWEAWKITRPVRVNITGPFSLTAAAPAPS